MPAAPTWTGRWATAERLRADGRQALHHSGAAARTRSVRSATSPARSNWSTRPTPGLDIDTLVPPPAAPEPGGLVAGLEGRAPASRFSASACAHRRRHRKNKVFQLAVAERPSFLGRRARSGAKRGRHCDTLPRLRSADTGHDRSGDDARRARASCSTPCTRARRWRPDRPDRKGSCARAERRVLAYRRAVACTLLHAFAASAADARERRRCSAVGGMDRRRRRTLRQADRGNAGGR